MVEGIHNCTYSPIQERGRTSCSNYQGISLLMMFYKIMSNIILGRLTPYVEEIIEDHQCGFRCKRSTIDQIFCIGRYWIKNGSMMAQYINYLQISKKTHDSLKRVVLYNILIEFVILKKLVKLINIYLSKTYSRVLIEQFLSDEFPIHCSLKQGDALSPLLFNFALGHGCAKLAHCVTAR